MKSEFETYGYHITSDPSFMDEQNAMTKELEKHLDKLLDIALKGKESGIKKFHKLIEQNPRNPQLKNYLSVLYMSIGDAEKSKEVNHWIVAEHPNYLFGKINLAFEHYTNGKPEKMADILGESMELKALYPQRDTFHIVEVIAMLKAAVFYFGALGYIDEAEARLDMMYEIDPESVECEQANRQLMAEKMKAGINLFNHEYEDSIKVEANRPKMTKTTEPPTFNHAEIGLLYNYDLTMSEEDIQTILALPRATLIQDLELVLTDSIERYAYFEKITDEVYNNHEMSFVIHSLYFLAELNAKESLDKIFEVFSQGEECLDLYIGDFLTENVWEILLKLEPDNLDYIKHFMQKPGIYTFAKTGVAHTLEHIVYLYPERKPEIIDWFEDLFNFYLNCKPEDNIIDGEMIGLVIASIIDFNGFELLPTIKKLDDKGYIFHGICGTYKDIESAMLEQKETYSRKEEILNLTDRYKQIISTWPDYMEDDDDVPIEMPSSYYQDEMNYFLEHNDGQPIIKDKKIGRNDPCPCGSGKKYKKCCLNN